MFVTFKEPELETLIEESVSDEWKSIVNSLELEGQKTLIERKKSVNDGKSNPNPYMALNKRWLKIFRTMCPSSVTYKKYAFSVIPMEALEEIALCVDKNFFDDVEIWWDDKSKDPLVVGVLKGSYSFENKYFLVGRFGDEILPLEIIEEKAKERMANHLRNEIAKALKTIDESVVSYLDRDEALAIKISDAHPYVN